MENGKWLAVNSLYSIDKTVESLWGKFDETQDEKIKQLIREEIVAFNNLLISHPEAKEKYLDFVNNKKLSSSVIYYSSYSPEIDICDKAAQTLSEMSHELDTLNRLHRKCMQHDAKTSAAEVSDKIRDKEMELLHEDNVFKMTFN